MHTLPSGYTVAGGNSTRTQSVNGSKQRLSRKPSSSSQTASSYVAATRLYTRLGVLSPYRLIRGYMTSPLISKAPDHAPQDQLPRVVWSYALDDPNGSCVLVEHPTHTLGISSLHHL